MAEHMQAVKTIWAVEWRTESGVLYREIIENAHQVYQQFIFLHNIGVSTAKLTESRTCTAMPGLIYTKENIIDVELLITA